jgi:hypothetical protein
MWLLGKIKDYILTAVGGLLAGALGSAFLQSLLLQLTGYQEGWYRKFAPLLLIPLVVLLLYGAWLAASKSKWRFVIATVLMVPTAALYLVARFFFPIGVTYSWIEFTSFWTFVAQLAGICLVGGWVLYWNAYDRTAGRSDVKEGTSD